MKAIDLWFCRGEDAGMLKSAAEGAGEDGGGVLGERGVGFEDGISTLVVVCCVLVCLGYGLLICRWEWLSVAVIVAEVSNEGVN